MISVDSSVKLADDVIFQELDGEAVLLDMRTEVYFGLNAMGVRIWELLKSHGKINKVKQCLLDEYEIGADEIQPHLMEFIERLYSKGLLSVE